MAYDDDHTNYGELFLDIKTALSVDKRVRQALHDRYLRDFSAVWGATSTERGGLVHDDYIPESYAQECINLAKGLTKHPITGRWVKDRKLTTLWRGGSVEVNPNGGIIVRQGASSIQLNAEDFDAFMTDLQDAYAAQPKPTGGTVGFGGTSSNDLLPEQKRIRERNEETMRKWSIASSKRFPNSR